ncbi:MAG: transglutaminase domain-containing protein [Anaerolineales bacterium]
MTASTNKRFLKPRWGDLVSGLLLLALLLVAAARLSATDWVENLGIIPILALLGGVAGLALGYSQFSGFVAFLFSIVYGLFCIFWRLGATMESSIPWNERIFSLFGRFGTSAAHLVQGQDIYDPILFLTAMGLLFWVLSTHAGYSLFRHGDAWASLLPVGAAMFIIHINDKFWPFRAWYLGIYLVLGLLLVARVSFLKLRSQWQKNRTRIPNYIGLDMSRAALLAAVPLILVAWTAPALAKGLPTAQSGWQELSQPFRDRFDYVFASLKATVGIVGDYYSDTLSLGRGNELSDMVVMTVTAQTIRPAGVRYYWKARTYDYYNENGWTSTVNSTEPISPLIFDQSLQDSPFRWTTTMVVKTNIPLRTLHAVSEVYSVSRPGNATADIHNDGLVDIQDLEADPYLRSGEQYEVKSALTSAGIDDLRASSTDYPQWILDRYTQLPDNITPRTRELAAAIVEGLDNPYDKAQAVTNFLRENIVYNERIDSPPDNQERVDWLIFDYRKGFCNYYATAEIVLLRSLGIPARMAVGYAEGERRSEIDLAAVPQLQPLQTEGDLAPYISDTSTYIVHQYDLHAWPEVYFPGIGWVEFEPTANQLPIFRPSGDPFNADANIGDAQDQAAAANLPDELADREAENQDLLPELPQISPQQELLQVILRVVLVIGGAGLIVLALWGLRRRLPPEPIPVQLESRMRKLGFKPPQFLVRWAKRAALSPLTKSYMEVNHALRRLGSRPGQADTPAERVHTLTNILPTATDPATYLLQEYQDQMYSPRPANGRADSRQAGKRIRNLSLWAWFNRLISRWQAPTRRS